MAVEWTDVERNRRRAAGHPVPGRGDGEAGRDRSGRGKRTPGRLPVRRGPTGRPETAGDPPRTGDDRGAQAGPRNGNRSRENTPEYSHERSPTQPPGRAGIPDRGGASPGNPPLRSLRIDRGIDGRRYPLRASKSRGSSGGGRDIGPDPPRRRDHSFGTCRARKSWRFSSASRGK